MCVPVAATDEIILSEIDKQIFEKHDDASFALVTAATFGPGAHWILLKAKKGLTKKRLTDSTGKDIARWVGYWKPMYLLAATIWWSVIYGIYDSA